MVFIGQDTAKAGAGQRSQPLIAIDLIRPKNGIQILGNLVIRFPDGFEVLDERPESPVSASDQFLVRFKQLIDIQCAEQRNMGFALYGFLQRYPHIGQQVLKCFKRNFLLKRDEITASQTDVALFGAVGTQYLQQFILGQIGCMQRKIQKAGGDGNAESGCGDLPDPDPGEVRGSTDDAVVFHGCGAGGQNVEQCIFRGGT